MRSLVILLLLLSPMWVSAQVVEPEPKPPIKFKAVAPASAKAGDHILIDASSAKGDVFFFFDEVAFPAKRATLIGKLLILSTPTNGTYTVHVASLDDKSKEKITFTVTSGVDSPVTPPLDPAPPTDPLEVLRQLIITKFAQLDARIAALEGAKPPPVSPLKHFTFVGPEATPTATAINNNASLRSMLKAAGVAVHVVSASNLHTQSAGFAKVVNDNGGVPIVVMQDEDGAVIGVAAMSNIQVVTDAVNKFIKR